MNANAEKVKINEMETKEKTNAGMRLTYKYPISSQTNGSRRHPTFLPTRSSSLSCFLGPINPTPVATIQSASGVSHFAFPNCCPTDVGRLAIRPSSSGHSQMSFLVLSKSRFMRHKNTWVRDILRYSHHHQRSETSSSLAFLVLFK
jgi:hypothetical protein